MESVEDTIKNAKKRSLQLFATGPYQININNGTLNEIYEAYKRIYGYDRLSDAQRIAWERELWDYLQNIYRTYCKDELPKYDAELRNNVKGWKLAQLHDIVNYRLDPQKAIDKLYNTGGH